MKTVTVQQLEAAIDDIVQDKKELAELKKETFVGVSQSELFAELDKRLGSGWTLKKDEPIKLTKSDLRAVSDSRFNRKTGIKILLLWGIIIAAMFILTYNLNWLPQYVMYGLGIAATFGFMLLYSRKQKRAREEFGRNIGRDIVRED
jgi:hypothetical protein